MSARDNYKKQMEQNDVESLRAQLAEARAEADQLKNLKQRMAGMTVGEWLRHVQKAESEAAGLREELVESKAQTLRISKEADMTAINSVELIRKHTKAVDGLAQELLDERSRSERLYAALNVSRGQWIHSVNAPQCLEALQPKPTEKL